MESLYLSHDYAETGRFKSAIEEAYRAIQLSPNYLPAHIQLGDLMARQERTEIAVEKFLVIGDTYRVRGDIEGAITSYERVVDLSPMDLANRRRLISRLVEQDRIDRALEHYMVMGEAYYNLAEVDKARRSYIEALKLAPRGNPDLKWRFRLLRAIADIDMQRLDWKRALMAYNELSAAEAADESIALTWIDLHYKVGQPRTALQQLDRFLMRLVRAGKTDKVIEILETLVEQRPTNAGLADRLVRLRLRQGRREEAIAVLDRLGEAQLEAGETKRAAATIERLLELEPPNDASYRQLLQRLKQDPD
jgi:tetratricopeptide (TPR) repeat protein